MSDVAMERSGLAAGGDDSVLEGPPAPLNERFFNRDLSWLEFNRRVLAQASDPDFPLLDRVKFLAIFASNLDEFFMKRVGLLSRRLKRPPMTPHRDGYTPATLLPEIRRVVGHMQQRQAALWEDRLRPELAEQGIRVLSYRDLTGEQRAELDRWYRSNVFPILTPLAVDPGHPFPFISNLSENLGVLVAASGAAAQFARLKVPDTVRRFVPVPGEAPETAWIHLEDLVVHNLDDLFPGLTIESVTPFRVTRAAGVEPEEDDFDDLLEHVETELRARRFAEAMRLELAPGYDARVRRLVCEELRLGESGVYVRRGPMEYSDLFQIAEIDRPDLKMRAWRPIAPPALRPAAGQSECDLFAAIRERDILLHHPYDSFGASVERFIDQAARDEDVLAIKQTIYRTSRDSPFVVSLIRAAERGKQVACLVELRARFDESRNVRFARQLEKHGVHVAYGVVGLKTHCKCSLVVRREAHGMRSYAHIGTGNYHPHTAQLYTDLGLLTANPAITDDVIALFNMLTGHSRQSSYHELLVAPTTMRAAFLRLIDGEIEHARAGRPARIVAKCNSLEDQEITERLYAASAAGVPVELFVRGFCCLRPGVPGLSEGIRVTSIIGRFLEHSRLYHFADGREDPLAGVWYIGSADWMHRNLNDRVEAAVPVYDAEARGRLLRIIEIMRRDHRRAWDLGPDGRYVARVPPADARADEPESVGTFYALIRDALARARVE